MVAKKWQENSWVLVKKKRDNNLQTANKIIEVNPLFCDENGHDDIINLKNEISRLNKFLPLAVTIKILQSRRKKPKTPISKRIENIGHVLGENTKGDCLVDSMTRFSYLIDAAPKLSLGIFYPTNLMHAWVELDNCLLHENEDFIGHYQKSVEYRSSI